MVTGFRRLFHDVRSDLCQLVLERLGRHRRADTASISAQNVSFHLRTYSEEDPSSEAAHLFETFLNIATIRDILSQRMRFVSLRDDPRGLAGIPAWLRFRHVSQHDELADFFQAVHSRVFIGSPSTYSWWISMICEFLGGRVLLQDQNIEAPHMTWGTSRLVPKRWVA